jgi:hypothetical protein
MNLALYLARVRSNDLLGDKRPARATSKLNTLNVDPVLESAFLGLTPVQLSRNFELTAAESDDLTALQRSIERLGEHRVVALNFTPDSGKAAFAWIKRVATDSFKTERRNDS